MVLAKGALFSGRPGLHQLAYLRAVAEGLDPRAMAEKYLGIAHGAAAPRAHLATVELVRALARRRKDPRWRLIGLRIQDPPEAKALRTHDEWAAAAGIDDGRSEAELLKQYREALGVPSAQERRRLQRNERLRAQRLQLLHDLARQAVVPAQPNDRLNGWFAPELAEALRLCGLLTLEDLRQRIHAGGAWWASVPALGKVKAKRVEAHLQLLLAAYPEVLAPAERSWPSVEAQAALSKMDARGSFLPLVAELPPDTANSELLGRGQDLVPAVQCLLTARNDTEAVQAWVAARAGSAATATVYERELQRYRTWLALERGRALGEASAEDCRAYMDFLRAVPERWISRRKVARLQAGWAPWRKQPSYSSQQLALDAIAACHAWLKATGYLPWNPWLLVNRHLGDDPDLCRDLDDPTSRAFTPEAWQALLAQVAEDAQAVRSRDQESARRNRWLLRFGESCGLRAAELLGAKVGDLKETREGWVLRVFGKGRRRRAVPVPSKALEATREYLASRGLALDAGSADASLVGALGRPHDAPSYSALAQALKALMRRAARRLDYEAGRQMQRASAHWLRHTHATRAAERGVPADALQENLGQSDPRTTGRYYRAQIQRRAKLMEEAFSGD